MKWSSERSPDSAGRVKDLGDTSLRVLLINCSHPSYNLGMEKARNWWTRQGAKVWYGKTFEPLMATQYDVIWLSAIFSWDVLELVRLARIALDAKVKVEVGGPGTFGAVQFIVKELALLAQCKPDPRFEREPGEYAYVFWSRGCPAYNCSLGYPKDGQPPVCSVPQMEGSRYTLYTDIEPARVIADNNLSALPRSHQELIVERTLAKLFKSVDANSGFEPHSMRPWVIEIWKRLPLVAWRFAYDELGEREKVLATLKMLADAGIRPYRCHIYCLAGNEPLADCERRVQEEKISEMGIRKWVEQREQRVIAKARLEEAKYLLNQFGFPALTSEENRERIAQLEREAALERGVDNAQKSF